MTGFVWEQKKMRMRILAAMTAFGLSAVCAAQDNNNEAAAGIDAQRAARIESHFARRIDELRWRTERDLMQLEAVEKARPVLAGPARLVNYVETVLALHNRTAVQPDNSIERLALAINRVAKLKSEIIGKMQFEAAILERQMHATLHRLEEEPANPAGPSQEVAPPAGMVTAIIYSTDKPATIIDGKLLHEGDTIDGVMVVKVYPDKVGLGKGDRVWTQHVGQQPPQ